MGNAARSDLRYALLQDILIQVRHLLQGLAVQLGLALLKEHLYELVLDVVALALALAGREELTGGRVGGWRGRRRLRPLLLPALTLLRPLRRVAESLELVEVLEQDLLNDLLDGLLRPVEQVLKVGLSKDDLRLEAGADESCIAWLPLDYAFRVLGAGVTLLMVQAILLGEYAHLWRHVPPVDPRVDFDLMLVAGTDPVAGCHRGVLMLVLHLYLLRRR